MPRDPAECRSSFSSASAGPTWPIKFWTSQRLEISQPLCHPPWSSSFTGISLFLTTKHELLLLPLLIAASCSFSVPLWEKLGFISPSPTHWKVEKHNSIPLCLVFSSPGGSKADLSTSSPCLPHSQKCAAAYPSRSLHQSTLLTKWVGTSYWVILLVTGRSMQNNKTTLLPYHQFVPITRTQECFCHCLHSGRAQGWAQSGQGRSCWAKAGSEHRQEGCADLQPG